MVMAGSTLAFATLSLVLLAGCAPQTATVTNNVTVETTTTNTDIVAAPADNTSALPDNAVAPPIDAPSLAAYAGKSPYDKVAGETFAETDMVKAAIAGSGASAEIRKWLADTTGPASPIVLQNDKLVMNECQEHNCSDHNWTIAIAPDGTAPEICYYDMKAGPKPLWFVGGQTVDRPAAGDEGCIQSEH
jgi:hypothetical protein